MPFNFSKNSNLFKCFHGSAFSYVGGIIPFGNADNILSQSQLSSKYSDKIKEVLKVESENISGDCSWVNSVMNSVDDVSCEYQIQGDLDHLPALEFVGIVETDISDFDSQAVKEFKDGISLHDGQYYVQLPWYPEKLKEVKSNFGICKAILNRVVDNLNAEGLFTAYDNVSKQQLEDGIIENIDLNKIDVDNNVWIPHKPVIKEDTQVTTKIRPVLNCSLKIGSSPSLNDASYPGIDSLSNLLSLLFMIRTNSTLVVADIRKAFLQIKLACDADKNRF